MCVFKTCVGCFLIIKQINKMQKFINIEELFRLAFEAGEEYADSLAFEAGEEYADSLEWATYADNFPSWYEKHKDEILQTILNEQTKCKNS